MDEYGMAFVPYSVETALASGVAAPPPSCSQTPTEVRDHKNNHYVLDLETAVNLNIALPVGVKASADVKRKVFVREVSRFTECDSVEGSAVLTYGAVWRATVMIDEAHATGNVTFAVAAASATLKNSSSAVAIENRGFTDPAVDEAGQKAMLAVKGGLDVTTFSKFNEAVEAAAGLASKSPVAKPLELIGVNAKPAGDIAIAIARTFALSCLAEGKTAEEAIQELPARTPAIQQAILDSYAEMERSVPRADSAVVRLLAARLLENRRLRRKRFWR